MFSWFRSRPKTKSSSIKKSSRKKTQLELSKRGADFIKRFEAYRDTAYKPHTDDVWTIGWGSTKDVTEGLVIDEAQAQEWFDRDVLQFEKSVHKFVKVPLNQDQFDALVSFTYNVGATNLKSSTLLRVLNEGDYEEAANQFKRWIFSKGKKLRGLTKRRNAEARIFRGES